MAFEFVQILYWLALSTWFGGVLFIAVSAPIIFRTVRESDPLLPMVLSVNLEGQHGTLLAGSIVANLLTTLIRVELSCAAGLLLAIIAQWFLADRGAGHLVASIIRSALYIGAAGMVLYDWLSLSPRIERARQDYLDNADNPEIANAAQERFDRYHKESVMVLTIVLALLLGMILFSAGIAPASHAQGFIFPT